VGIRIGLAIAALVVAGIPSYALGEDAGQKEPVAQFSKEIALPPLQMSMKDFTSFLARLRALLQQINGSDCDDLSVSLSDKASTLDFDAGGISKLQPDRMPSRIFEMTISYECRNKAVSEFALIFLDSGRSVTVKGTDFTSVLNTADLAEKFFEPFQRNLTGYKARTYIGLAFFVAVFVLVGLVSYRWALTHFDWSRWMLPIGAALSLLALEFFLIQAPAERWFPGFLIHDGSPSLFDRYAGQIGLLSNLVLWLIPPIYMWRSSRR
jgi:hypothetical protein